MALEVVGAGFGRTGTLSLKHALETLGFDKCYHMLEVAQNPGHHEIWAAAHRGEAVDWDALFRDYRAAVDWPSCNLWEAQAAHWPESRVLLSTRDPGRWYESVMNTIYPTTVQACESQQEIVRGFGNWAVENIWNRVFDGRMDDRAHCIDVYLRHEEYVKKTVPADRLLVFEAAQGWEPLCRFLDRPVPDEPFPRVNTTEDFRQRTGTR